MCRARRRECRRGLHGEESGGVDTGWAGIGWEEEGVCCGCEGGEGGE